MPNSNVGSLVPFLDSLAFNPLLNFCPLLVQKRHNPDMNVKQL